MTRLWQSSSHFLGRAAWEAGGLDGGAGGASGPAGSAGETTYVQVLSSCFRAVLDCLEAELTATVGIGDSHEGFTGVRRH